MPIKKYFAFFSFFLLIFTAQPAGAQDSMEPTFPDVGADSPYFAAVEYLHEKGIIQGYSDGTFRPNQEANRAEALKIILLSSDIELSSSDVELSLFPDVNLDDWFYPYIKKAGELGIIEGYEDGYFRPERIQNLAETLKIILLTNDVAVEEIPPAESIYPDVTGDLWYAPYAAYAKEKNLVPPEADGNLNAARGIKRGDLSIIMYRLDIVSKNNGEPFDISTNWPVLDYPSYAFKTKKPFDWKIVNNEDQVVFWLPDEINHQSSYELPYPYSASVTFHLDENADNLTQQEYIENLEMVYKSDFGTYQKNSLQIGDLSAVEFNVSPVHDDYYLFLDSGKILHAYTSYGWSDISDYLVKQIDGIVKNISEISQSHITSGDDFLSDVRSKILVEGIGQETLDSFPDLIIIETDTIGVGTGPVDYYYSEEYDVTLKYERASDTILDMQNGKTSAF
jgi:hypothetical protein